MFHNRSWAWVRCIILCVAILLVGCGYGEVSPKTYEIATALYNISNRKLADKLEEAQGKIQAARAQEEITQQEADWLNQIVAHGQQQEWQKAMKAARRMMEDQVAD